MENEVDALVRLLVEQVGVDLTSYTTHNNLWHTGVPTDVCVRAPTSNAGNPMGMDLECRRMGEARTSNPTRQAR